MSFLFMAVDYLYALWNEREVVKRNAADGQFINKLNNHDLQISESIPYEDAVILFVLFNAIYSELRMEKRNTELLLKTS